MMTMLKHMSKSWKMMRVTYYLLILTTTTKISRAPGERKMIYQVLMMGMNGIILQDWRSGRRNELPHGPVPIPIKNTMKRNRNGIYLIPRSETWYSMEDSNYRVTSIQVYSIIRRLAYSGCGNFIVRKWVG